MNVGHLEVTSAINFSWRIENFSKKVTEVGEFIMSPTFDPGDCVFKNCPKWNLKLYPFGSNEESKDCISLFLSYTPWNTATTEYVCSYEMSIYIQDGTQIDKTTTQVSKDRKFTIVDPSWGWRTFIKRSILFEKQNTLLKDDMLIISCSINDVSLRTECPSVSSLMDSYQSLHSTADFSDITIVIGDKNLKVHKAVLSVRSKVFSAMFRNDMTESSTNTIRITDVEYTVMNKFLLFLYSGKVENIEMFAKSLIPVADKYDVNDLKDLCEAALFNNVTIDNACELLSFADLYNCGKLKRKIIAGIISNIKKIVKTQGFEDLSNLNHTLFKEIFYEIVEEKCK